MPAPMRILIFHGYLLRGTGSNVYNARLAPALRRAGPRGPPALPGAAAPRSSPFVDAVGTGRAADARVEALREPVRVTV